jgi:hypothetical protein
MPIGSAGHAGAFGVNFLMTTDATQRRHAATFSTAYDICEMAMAVITLLRIVRSGVTIDATG